METLTAGGDFEVQTMAGATETVRIRQLAFGEFPVLLAAQDDEVAAACLYTGRDAEWVAGLTMESQERVVLEGERINADFFVRWFQRRLGRQEKLMPGSTEKFLRRATDPEASPRSPSLNLPPPPVRSRA